MAKMLARSLRSMKYIKSIAVICAVSFAGELMHTLVPLPVPGSIYGLIIMFVLLLTGAVKLSDVKSVGDFLITLMPIMFVAPAAGLITSFESYRGFIVPMVAVVIVTTPLTMVVTGKVADALIRVEEKKKDSHKLPDNSDSK